VSRAARLHLIDAPLPSVTLPPDLERVFRDYERILRTGDARALAELFTEDGLIPGPDGWIRGRKGIRLAQLGSSSDLPLRALSYAVDDSVAYIAAFGSRPANPDFARLLFALRKRPDGKWLIAARLGGNFRGPTADTVPRTADNLIAELDSFAIQRAVVLSVAYFYGSPNRDVEVADQYTKVRAENDWVAQEVGRYPNRLVGFCSFNPLKDYALEELERCHAMPQIRGVKLHFANSGVDLRNPEHVQQLRRIFRAANRHRMPMVVHLRTLEQSYGAQDAEIFLRDVLPEATNTMVQLAHLAGWGGYDEGTDHALQVFAGAIAARDKRTDRLYFDISGMGFPSIPAARRELIVQRIRQIGTARILFGRDGIGPQGDVWAEIRKLLPLNTDEFTAIARNVAPYLR